MSVPPARMEPIPVSAVQHAVYCLRQAGLIHLERLWAENKFTAEGDVLHAVADKGGHRRVRGIRRVYSLPITSERLNLTGLVDMVEFVPCSEGGETAFPVEYKRGKPKAHRSDEAQLCAQALCLEEMTRRPVLEGALFYAQTKRRVIVSIDAALRSLTEAAVDELAKMLASRRTPPPTPHKSRCRACSLAQLCLPDTISRSARQWRDRMLERALAETC